MKKFASVSAAQIEAAKLGSILSGCPSFSSTGSVYGMRKRYYGQEALLLRCGAYIYNVTAEPKFHKFFQTPAKPARKRKNTYTVSLQFFSDDFRGIKAYTPSEAIRIVVERLQKRGLKRLVDRRNTFTEKED